MSVPPVVAGKKPVLRVAVEWHPVYPLVADQTGHQDHPGSYLFHFYVLLVMSEHVSPGGRCGSRTRSSSLMRAVAYPLALPASFVLVAPQVLAKTHGMMDVWACSAMGAHLVEPQEMRVRVPSGPPLDAT